MNLTPEEKSKLYGLFQSKKTELEQVHNNWKRTTNSDILLIDGTNTYLRCWSANPSMDENGNHTGGIIGFLKSIGYAIKLLSPTRCIIIFDGVGGSFKRKKIYPQYKERRSGTLRLNRSYEEMSDVTTEEESCRKQYIRLLHYLKALPVNLLSIDHVEADDVIAFLALDYFKDSRKITIMSSDKDFLQLCSNRISVYSPTKKRVYGPAEVVNDYSIHPNNFVIYRALDGDNSDNINGIEGAGPKTIVKHFPWLKDETEHTIDEIIKCADNLKNKYKVCENITENRTIINRNMELMQLKNTALTTQAQLYCYERMETKNIPILDRNVFFKLIRDDMVDRNLPNYVNWVNDIFSSLDRVTRTE